MSNSGVPVLKSSGGSSSNRSSPLPIITQNGIPPPSPSTTPLSDSSATNLNSRLINNNKSVGDGDVVVVAPTAAAAVATTALATTAVSLNLNKGCQNTTNSTDIKKPSADKIIPSGESTEDDGIRCSESPVDTFPTSNVADSNRMAPSSSFIEDNLSIKKSPTTIIHNNNVSADDSEKLLKISENSQNNLTSNTLGSILINNNNSSSSTESTIPIRLNPDIKAMMEEIAAKDREVRKKSKLL